VPSWNQLLDELTAVPDAQKGPWIQEQQLASLRTISQLRGGRHVLFYASAFLQKPQAPPPTIQITHEEINGFMSSIHGMEWSRGVTILMHSPGGVTNAAETIVAYLRTKFSDIEVIVPAFAMSAATMITLAADRVIMGRQSQLGPIDPHFIVGQLSLSARAVVDQFERARRDIKQNVQAAHVWAPLLGSIGPALLQEAHNALQYGERMVAQWLEKYMFRSHSRRKAWAKSAARHFNDATRHKSHGRRIDREEARSKHINIEDLEADQALQEAVLTSYHLVTILFEKGPATKVILSDTGKAWVKNWAPPQVPFLLPQVPGAV
jgi:hypothetical protein